MSAQVFDTILEGIHDAMVQLNRGMQAQHQPELFDRYFEETEIPDDSEDGFHLKLRAKTITIQVPIQSDTGDIVFKDMEVPLLSLVPVRSMQVKHLKIKFQVRMQGAKEDKDRKGRKRRFLQVDFGGGGIFSRKSNMAEVEVHFEGTDPPEGWLKVNGQFNKMLP